MKTCGGSSRRPELRFESRGEHALKGLGQPIRSRRSRSSTKPSGRRLNRKRSRSRPRGPSGWRRCDGARSSLQDSSCGRPRGRDRGLILRDRGALTPSDALAENAAPGVAVVLFSVNDPELERWREGMVDLLTNLDGAGGLRAIDSRTVLARWRELVPEDGVADLYRAEVARRSGGRYGLIGSAVSSGATIRLAAEVYDLDGGAALESAGRGSPDSIFALVDRLSIAVLGVILEQQPGASLRVDSGERDHVLAACPQVLPRGRGVGPAGDFANAIPAYEDAVEVDSTFALAHVRLGRARLDGRAGLIVRQGVRDRQALLRAIPAREADLLDVTLAYASGHEDATRLAQDASQRYPDDPVAWYLLREAYFHLPYQSLASLAKAEALRAGDPSRSLVSAGRDPSPSISRSSLRTRRGPIPDAAFRALDREHRLWEGVFDRLLIAFGDSVSSLRAIAGMDTLEFAVMRKIPTLLNHPRFTAAQRAVNARRRSRPEYASVAPGWTSPTAGPAAMG